MFEDLGLEEEHSGAYIPDEPEGLSLPQHNALCLGHDSVEAALLKMYNAQSMPHSICLTGPKGIGKSTLAYRLTRFLFHDMAASNDGLFGGSDMSMDAESMAVSQNSDAFIKVASGGHPDLLVIEREYDDVKNTRKGAVTVEDIRRIPTFMRSTAAMGGWRICIIDDADTMNMNAQNALLKVLEEPPKKAMIIMIAHRMGAFLPTIRSRVRVMPMRPLEKQNFEQLATRLDIDPQYTSLIYALSEGSIGVAQELADHGGLDVIDKVFACFPQGELKLSAVLQLSDSLALKTAEPQYRVFEMFLKRLLESIIDIKVRHTDNAFVTALKERQLWAQIEPLVKKTDLKTWVARYDALKDHFVMCNRAYLDKKFAVMHGFTIVSGQNKE